MARPTFPDMVGRLRYLPWCGGHEHRLHDKIEEMLTPLTTFVREGRISPRSRVDFLVDCSEGAVVVEVKVKGEVSDVQAQVKRYLARPSVVGLILVTTVAKHRNILPAEVCPGRSLAIVYLSPLK